MGQNGKKINFTARSYIGNKWRLVDFIRRALTSYGLFTESAPVHSVADLFAGTGLVSWLFANAPGVDFLWSNDYMPCCKAITRARLSCRSSDSVSRRIHKYEELCSLDQAQSTAGLIESIYASGSRPFYTRRVARYLDAMFRVVPSRDHDVRGALLEFMLRVANANGKFDSAYLRSDLRNNTPSIIPVEPRGSLADCKVTSWDVSKKRPCLDREYDLVYIDPPYTNKSNYMRFYHLLNTMTKGDSPGTTGKFHIRDDVEMPVFASIPKAIDAFASLITSCAERTKYIALSYSSEGLLSLQCFRRIFRDAGCSNIKTYRTQIPRYGLVKDHVQEYLMIASTSRK